LRTATLVGCMAAILGHSATARAQHVHELGYVAFLNGANEATPNGSQGVGTAKVLIDLIFYTMRVQGEFQGLTGQVSSAHLHGITTSPGAGVADVMINVPTLPGFPAGVTEGSYDQSINLALDSSYNPTFFAATGGSASLASNAMFVALDAGKTYFNIHTTEFGDGEIRGFLLRTRPADFDFDGFVASPDLDVWKQWFAIDHFGDATGDGMTNGADFLVWQRQLGMMASLPGDGGHQHLVPVPEPSAKALAVAAVAAAAWRRRKSLGYQALLPVALSVRFRSVGPSDGLRGICLQGRLGSAMIRSLSRTKLNWVEPE
jgi:hypothetical protein